ncbi:MAG: cupin domain-containing protein [Planctomycetes bacterium]|nr:cupin domain-containing protein [Planctomycetota bacterium]
MASEKLYEIAHMDEVRPVDCPCGSSRRAFVSQGGGTASFHIVEIKEDAVRHYHKKLTEVYYILEGRGQMELDDETIEIQQGDAILIKPGCRHRALGQFKIINVVVPVFDPEDEWFD